MEFPIPCRLSSYRRNFPQVKASRDSLSLPFPVLFPKVLLIPLRLMVQVRISDSGQKDLQFARFVARNDILVLHIVHSTSIENLTGGHIDTAMNVFGIHNFVNYGFYELKSFLRVESIRSKSTLIAKSRTSWKITYQPSRRKSQQGIGITELDFQREY